MNRTIAVSLLVAACCVPAMGDLSGFTGWTDPETGITWEGVSEMKAEKESAPDTYLWADVEWVVPWDSSAGQFHYIYQVTCRGDYDISVLAVPMLPSNEAQNIGWFATGAGEVAPQSGDFTPLPPEEPSLASWAFAGLANGQVSYALDYWSVNKPTALGGYIQDGGLFAVNGLLPSPDNVIPEPATMSLVVFGGAAALLRRRRR